MRRVLREISGGYAAVVGRSVDFLPQPLGRHIDPQGLGGYYCDLRHKATETIDVLPRDGHGDPDWWVIPIAQSALGYWELRLDGEETEEEFLILADWLLDNSEPGVGGVVWRTDKRLPKYGLGPGWASGMAQGQAASVLLRAHALTGRDVYLETALAAFAPLTVPVAKGGLQSELDGVTVLEEYPTLEPAAILNGWIFALFGVHELGTVADVAEARELFERSAAGLVSLLPRYDNGWWSLYSLYDHVSPDLAKPFYQRLHPVMLDALGLLRPDPELERYADRWRAQLTKPAIARASLNKIGFRLRRTYSDPRMQPPSTDRT